MLEAQQRETNDALREQWEKYELESGLISFPKNQGIGKRAFTAGYQACLSSLPTMSESELMNLLEGYCHEGPVISRQESARCAARALIERFPFLGKGA